jgi:hypothetical protein
MTNSRRWRYLRPRLAHGVVIGFHQQCCSASSPVRPIVFGKYAWRESHSSSSCSRAPAVNSAKCFWRNCGLSSLTSPVNLNPLLAQMRTFRAPHSNTAHKPANTTIINVLPLPLGRY